MSVPVCVFIRVLPTRCYLFLSIPLDICRTRSAINVLYIYLNTFRISLQSTKMIHSTERYSEIENKRDKRTTEIHAQSIHSSPRIEVFHGCAADGPLSLDKYPSPPFSITYCDIQYPWTLFLFWIFMAFLFLFFFLGGFLFSFLYIFICLSIFFRILDSHNGYAFDIGY